MRSKDLKMQVANNKGRMFTKSAFKIALECPAQLYYYHEPQEYANQNQTDEFLQALAEGGFQVGEQAKIYCGVDEGCDLADMSSYEQPVARTRELKGSRDDRRDCVPFRQPIHPASWLKTASRRSRPTGMLQFCGREMVNPLKQALLRYCELDTMAMVFIREYLNKACNAVI